MYKFVFLGQISYSVCRTVVLLPPDKRKIGFFQADYG